MTQDILRVVEPGLSTTIQDRGRFGSQRFGVSTSGAIDPLCHALANRLVGNHEDEATLELTLTGGVYDVLAERIAIALVGADMPLSVGGESRAANRTHVATRGERIEIGTARSGLRAYFAIGGGIDVPPVLGSRATHLRSGFGGLGGRTLAMGDRLPGTPGEAPAPLMLRPSREPYFGGVVRIVPGPQADMFTPGALELLSFGRYRLSTQFDRMAARLIGPHLPFVDGFNIISDGIVTGSIQVPGHGEPLVLLADNQTTGGYPKIATIVTPDIRIVGQRRPNQKIQFALTTIDEAEERYLRWREAMDRLEDHLVPAT